jgi:glutamate dehydrogenase
MERALRELGIDPGRDPFSVKLTGGPNGDVAGNQIKLLLQRCPHVRITSLTDASGVIYTPEGIDKQELMGLIHKADIDRFSPARLRRGGFILYSREQRREGLRDLFKRVSCAEGRTQEEWVSSDEFHGQFENFIFLYYTDVFIPCGGRPETIHDGNWQKLLDEDHNPTTRAIIEGANSFISPSAREKIQRRGIIILRDASANKCGVICSSHEIIGGLVMKEKEFLKHKEEYIQSVLAILEQRAVEESELIFQRYRLHSGARLYTELSDEISREINQLTSTVYDYLLAHPEKLETSPYAQVLLLHLPLFVRERKKFRDRVKRLPFKYRVAMTSSQIATRSVYHGGLDIPFEERLEQFVRKYSRESMG